MKVIGINGSARKDGNTAILLNREVFVEGSTYRNMAYLLKVPEERRNE